MTTIHVTLLPGKNRKTKGGCNLITEYIPRKNEIIVFKEKYYTIEKIIHFIMRNKKTFIIIEAR